MENPEFKKSKIFSIAKLHAHSSEGVVIKNIIKKATGNVNAIFIDKGEELTEALSRFDHFIEIIEGQAEILIDDQYFVLNSGEAIIIPANSKNTIKANERSKIVSTIIKSGYE